MSDVLFWQMIAALFGSSTILLCVLCVRLANKFLVARRAFLDNERALVKRVGKCGCGERNCVRCHLKGIA